MKAFKLAPIALALLVIGCTSDDLLLQRRVDYRSGSDNISKAPLDVPPDLTAPATNSSFLLPARTLLGATATVGSGNGAKAKLVTAGGQRWLVVSGQAEKIWSETREFWLSQGFILTMDNAATGIMETDWLENHANLPKDTISRLLSKVSSRFASTGELDKYRIRMERGTDPETTEIFITHRGMTEAYRNDGSTKFRNQKEEVGTIWIPRASDPELEAEMLVLLMQQFGIEPQAARTIIKTPAEQITQTTLTTSATGEKTLSIADSYDRAWRRTGLAIERIGFVINDRDRAKGIFYVRRAEADINNEINSGFISKLAFWRDTEEQKKAAAQVEYMILLKSERNQTTLSLKPKEKPDTALEKQLLDGLLKQLM